MQKECDLRMKNSGKSYLELPFIDVSKSWKDNYIIHYQMKQYYFIKHFTYVQPNQFQDEFLQPSHRNKIIDPFNSIVINIFTVLSITLGYFSSSIP